MNGRVVASSIGEKVPARKVKVEFFDDVGTKHTITLEGAITKEKIGRVLDYVELMGRLPNSSGSGSGQPGREKFERMRGLLSEFQGRAFRSNDIQHAYEERYGEPIGLTTVCTYLSRFVDRGVVLRSGSPAEWLYMVRQPGTFSWDSLPSK